MKNLLKKVTAITATGLFALSVVITPAFANNDMTMLNDDQKDNLPMLKHFDGRLLTVMTGSQEVPGPADSDGFGFVRVKIQQANGKLCVNMRVFNIEPATAAHVHQGAEGVAGPVVVTLPTPDANGNANGCVDVDSTKLKDIQDNPSNYYINVHNATYPGGALRGQLFGL